MRSAWTLGKQQRRTKLEAELAARIFALPDRFYGVINADPGYRFEPYSRITGMDRAADNHYVTSPTDQIKAIDVASIAAPDSVLFLWATVPMLEQAFAVIRSWGFTYKSNFTWVKTNRNGGLHLGTGYWNRNCHEHFLVGTRGGILAPAPGTQRPSVIYAPVGRHSAKPEVFYELVEAYYPTLSKCELFARTARPGWDRWGLEAP
jgi:N6-adenosine-specific RNA methylase IME4